MAGGEAVGRRAQPQKALAEVAMETTQLLSPDQIKTEPLDNEEQMNQETCTGGTLSRMVVIGELVKVEPSDLPETLDASKQPTPSPSTACSASSEQTVEPSVDDSQIKTEPDTDLGDTAGRLNQEACTNEQGSASHSEEEAPPGSQEEALRCEVCDAWFTDLPAFRSHTAEHEKVMKKQKAKLKKAEAQDKRAKKQREKAAKVVVNKTAKASSIMKASPKEARSKDSEMPCEEYACPLCGITFTKQRSLAMHLRAHPKCDTCKERMVSKQQLHAHTCQRDDKNANTSNKQTNIMKWLTSMPQSTDTGSPGKPDSFSPEGQDDLAQQGQSDLVHDGQDDLEHDTLCSQVEKVESVTVQESNDNLPEEGQNSPPKDTQGNQVEKVESVSVPKTHDDLIEEVQGSPLQEEHENRAIVEYVPEKETDNTVTKESQSTREEAAEDSHVNQGQGDRAEQDQHNIRCENEDSLVASPTNISKTAAAISSSDNVSSTSTCSSPRRTRSRLSARALSDTSSTSDTTDSSSTCSNQQLVTSVVPSQQKSLKTIQNSNPNSPGNTTSDGENQPVSNKSRRRGKKRPAVTQPDVIMPAVDKEVTPLQPVDNALPPSPETVTSKPAKRGRPRGPVEHKTEAREPLKCGTCGTEFSNIGLLKNHIRSHKWQHPHICGSCGKPCSSALEMKEHHRVHTADKPFKCNDCDAAFTRRFFLELHVRTHTGEKPFKCDLCDKAFAQSSHLKMHLKVHSGEKTRKCLVCGVAFLMASKLKDHMRIHSGERPFACHLCDKVFAQAYYLKIHLRTHSGDKPYKCAVCGTGFRQSCHVIIHMRRHTGENPYSCDLCGAAFRHSPLLKKHKKEGCKPSPANARAATTVAATAK